MRHPENLALTGNGRIIIVAMHDYVATLDLLLITGIEQPNPEQEKWRASKSVLRQRPVVPLEILSA